MGSKKAVPDVRPLPDEEELVCYRCGNAPAEVGKQLRTPSGGMYYRGWCVPCSNGQDDNMPRRSAETLEEDIKKMRVGQFNPAQVDERLQARRAIYRIGTMVRLDIVARMIAIHKDTIDLVVGERTLLQIDRKFYDLIAEEAQEDV